MPFRLPVLILFFLYVAAWVALVAMVGYGVILGIATLASEPRGTQVIVAIGSCAAVFVVALALVARGDR